MKQCRILPVYILSCTKERKRLRKFNNCYAKRLPFGQKTQIQIDHMVLNIKGKEIRQFYDYLDNINYYNLFILIYPLLKQNK